MTLSMDANDVDNKEDAEDRLRSLLMMMLASQLLASSSLSSVSGCK